MLSKIALRDCGSTPTVGSSSRISARIVHEGRGEVQAPLHAARVGADPIAQRGRRAARTRAPSGRGSRGARRRARRSGRRTRGSRGRSAGRRAASDCGARPIRRRTSGSAGLPPPSRTSPASGSSRPTARCTVVLLPAPFGPSSPKISPRRTSSVRSVDGGGAAEGLPHAGQGQHRARAIPSHASWSGPRSTGPRPAETAGG